MILLVMTINISHAQPQWANFGDWAANPIEFAGNWSNMVYHSPVVSDLDNDGDKEILITDNTRVRVYAHDADDEGDNFLLLQPNLPNGRVACLACPDTSLLFPSFLR